MKNGSYCNKWTVKSTGEKKVSFTGRYRCPNQCRERYVYSGKTLEDAVFQAVEKYLEMIKGIDVTEEWRKRQIQHRMRMERQLQAVEREIRMMELDMETLEGKIPEAIRGDYCFSAEKLSCLLKEKAEILSQKRDEEKRIRENLRNTVSQNGKMANRFGVPPDWGQEFGEADTETKRMLLSSLIERIEVRDSAVNIKFRFRMEELTES